MGGSGGGSQYKYQYKTLHPQYGGYKPSPYQTPKPQPVTAAPYFHHSSPTYQPYHTATVATYHQPTNPPTYHAQTYRYQPYSYPTTPAPTLPQCIPAPTPTVSTNPQTPFSNKGGMNKNVPSCKYLNNPHFSEWLQ